MTETTAVDSTLSDREQLAQEIVATDFDAIERDDVRAKQLPDRVSVDERVGYHWRTREIFDRDALETATSDADVSAASIRTYEPERETA